MAKSPRAKLVKLLDSVWSKAIRKKYGRCVVCGSKDNLHSHHCIVRKAQSQGVRWLEFNGVPLCCGCHLYKYHGQQADKEWHEKFIEILNSLIPHEKQEEIRKIGHGITKYSIDDLRELVTKGWWAKKEVQQ